MDARRISGLIAVTAGAGLLVLALVSSVAGAWNGPGWTTGTGTPGTPYGPGMMGGYGPSMMGGGYGPSMMGGSGMMGGGHMWPYGSQTTGAPIADAPTVTVTARDVSFSPTETTLPKDEVNLTLVNEGGVLHDLTIPALGVRVVAAAGQTATAGLRDLRPGRYDGFCSVPGHAAAGMRITVVVQ